MPKNESNDRERVGDRVTIYPRGKKRILTAEFWHAGQHRRKSLGTSNRKVARRRALEIEHQLQRGEFAAEPADAPPERPCGRPNRRRPRLRSGRA